MRLAAAFGLLAGLFLGGCGVCSVAPIYTDVTTRCDALMGVWRSEGGSDAGFTTIAPRESGGYVVSFEGKDPPDEVPRELEGVRLPTLIAVPVRLEGQWLLDVECDTTGTDPTGLTGLMTISLHHIWRFRAKEETLAIESMDARWLESWIAANPGVLDVLNETPDRVPGDAGNGIRLGGRVVLTSSTARIRRFLTEHAGDARAWYAHREYTLYQSLDRE